MVIGHGFYLSEDCFFPICLLVVHFFATLQPLHEELYRMDPSAFFLPTFLEAVRTSTEESLASIMTEPTPGVFSFAMLQPNFCDMLLEEVW